MLKGAGHTEIAWKQKKDRRTTGRDQTATNSGPSEIEALSKSCTGLRGARKKSPKGRSKESDSPGGKKKVHKRKGDHSLREKTTKPQKEHTIRRGLTPILLAAIESRNGEYQAKLIISSSRKDAKRHRTSNKDEMGRKLGKIR